MLFADLAKKLPHHLVDLRRRRASDFKVVHLQLSGRSQTENRHEHPHLGPNFRPHLHTSQSPVALRKSIEMTG